jgi:hypothetical protein
VATDASAYAALGLSPGADPDAIESAYRTLIKRYHPDREGGDTARASEINEAYRQLRTSIEQSIDKGQPASLAEALYARRPRRLMRRRKKKSRLWLVVGMVGATLAYVERQELTDFANQRQEFASRMELPPQQSANRATMPVKLLSLDGQLDQSAIAASVRRAAALHQSGNADRMEDESRACHQKLRELPSLRLLDQCAAFDDAVLELQRPDPFADEGPFGATAIAARQISAGTLLSDDYLSIDGRLDRVRSSVRSMLAQPTVPPESRPSNGAEVSG